LKSDGTDAVWSPTTDITQLGTITSGDWNASPILSAYIASSSEWTGFPNKSTSPGKTTALAGQEIKKLTISKNIVFIPASIS